MIDEVMKKKDIAISRHAQYKLYFHAVIRTFRGKKFWKLLSIRYIDIKFLKHSIYFKVFMKNKVSISILILSYDVFYVTFRTLYLDTNSPTPFGLFE